MASKELYRAIELDSSQKFYFNSFAILYDELAIYDSALHYFNKAIEIDPDFAYGYNNRGNCHRHMKQYEKARQDVQHSLSLDDDNGWAYATLAMIYADEDYPDDQFFSHLTTAIQKPKPYPLKERLELESTLQGFKDDPRFQALLRESKF